MLTRDLAVAEGPTIEAGEPTMNQQWEGRGSEYFFTPIVVPDITVVGPALLVKAPRGGEYTTAHGIVVPEQARERVSQGLVLLVGDGVLLENGVRLPSRYRPGMEVLYSKYAGAEIELYGNGYLIINEVDVRCILEVYKLDMREAGQAEGPS